MTGPVVVGVLPILSDFEVSISQTDKLSSNGSSTPKTSVFHSSYPFAIKLTPLRDDAEFLISLKAPSVPTSPPSRAPFMTSFAFVRDSLDSSTTDFVSQLKRLHEVASTSGYTDSSKSHEWGRVYLPPSATSTPIATTPNEAPISLLSKKYASPDYESSAVAYSSRATLKPNVAGSSRVPLPFVRSARQEH